MSKRSKKMKLSTKIAIASIATLGVVEITFLCSSIFLKFDSGPTEIKDFDIIVGEPNDELWLETGYSNTQWKVSTSKINVEADVTYELKSGCDSKIELTDDNFIAVAAGLADDEYDFTIIATATYEAFAPKIIEQNFVLDVDNGEFNNFTLTTSVGETVVYNSGDHTYNCEVSTITPVPDSCNYEFVNKTTPLGASAYLTINSTSGQVKLLNDAPVGDYKYEVKVTAAKQHHNSKSVTSSLTTLTVAPAQFSDFTVSNPGSTQDVVYTHSDLVIPSVTSTISPDPSTYLYELINVTMPDGAQTGTLSINGDTGSVKLREESPVGTYTYTVKLTVSKENYQTKIATSSPATINVVLDEFSDFDIVNDLGYSYENDNYSADETTLSLSMSLPTGTDISFALKESDLGDKLTLSDDELSFATGLGLGIYTYKITATASKTGYTTKTVTTTYHIYVQKFLDLQMTSNQTQSYTASASSEYSDGNAAYKAFDDDEHNEWCSGDSEASATSWWLAIDLGAEFALTDYEIKGGLENEYWGPRQWDIQYSDDAGANWTTIDSAESSADTSVYETFHIAQEDIGLHQYYRMLITKSSNIGYVEISDWKLYCAFQM